MPDADVSWVEAVITKGHIVNEATVEVMIEGDSTEECADRQPEIGSIRQIDVRPFIWAFNCVNLDLVCLTMRRLSHFAHTPCCCTCLT